MNSRAQIDDLWPDLRRGRILLAPVRVGIDRRTGAMMVGWPHVLQSIETILMTRYHERVLRRWAGSFVPHILRRIGDPARHHSVLLGHRLVDRIVGAELSGDAGSDRAA